MTFGRPLWETKQSVSSDEFVKWRAYYRVEPWGDEWLQTSSVMSMLFNHWRRRGVPAAKPDEFIPKLRKPEPQKAAQDIATLLTAYANMHNASLQRK